MTAPVAFIVLSFEGIWHKVEISVDHQYPQISETAKANFGKDCTTL